jgi:hypothetical protein
MSSLPTQRKQIYFFDLSQLKDLPPLSKERSYYNQHPTDQFLLLIIKVFDYLHKHVNVFLHDCANAIWSLKGLKGLHISTLDIFFNQKTSIML